MTDLPSSSARTLPHFIANRFTGGEDGGHLRHVNPSDAEDTVALVPQGSARDVQEAVDAGSMALGRWRALPGPARAEHLYRWAAAVLERHEELADTIVREVGKPIGEARGEVARCVVILRYYAGEAVRSIGEVIPAQAEGSLQFSLREPLGVVALITPWNFPIAIPLWKAAPALAFGNTVVLKPSEAASLVATRLAETALAAGLPPGAFNVVLGEGPRAGEALLRADAVRAVSFTGSLRVGARVAAVAAERNIRYQTEMGGKNVVIVAADADLDRAARLTAGGAMRFAGQKCTATSRAVVVRSVEDEFVDRLCREVEALPLGPVTDPSCAVGPLISEASRGRIRQSLAGAEGERVLGDGLPDDDAFARGWYFPPTVLRDVPADSALAQDELFGPVLSVHPVDDLDTAIATANHTRYGLSASLFTRDLGTALEYVRTIEVGLVRVNGDTTGVDPHAPFGGLKASSSGSREQGPAAREFYTEIRTVQING
jgi:aldehyde dehydrogenase (NAD+)